MPHLASLISRDRTLSFALLIDRTICLLCHSDLKRSYWRVALTEVDLRHFFLSESGVNAREVQLNLLWLVSRLLMGLGIYLISNQFASLDWRLLIESHVVKSRIPLLWSCPSMKKAGTVLDLPEDKAKIFDQWVSLNLTTVGHYSL